MQAWVDGSRCRDPESTLRAHRNNARGADSSAGCDSSHAGAPDVKATPSMVATLALQGHGKWDVAMAPQV